MDEGLALVANIGGTHARFGLASASPDGKPQVFDIKQFLTGDFKTLTEAAAQYLDGLSRKARPSHGVFAVASAITSDLVKITNNPWTFSIQSTQRELGLSALDVVNDFCALSRALPLLEADHLCPLGAAPARTPSPQKDATYVVLGPGTGLGVGCLAMRKGLATIIESEGGHISFAPSGRYEAEVLGLLERQFGRVSAERLISGSGLLNLYLASCTIDGVPATAQSPAEITERAYRDHNGACARAVMLFCKLLGAFAGDMALIFGAWDGVFLAGGVVQKVLPWLDADAFRGHFEAKGRHQALMQTVPVQVILHPHAELAGAACMARSS